MKYLSDLCADTKEEKLSALKTLVNAYEKWIAEVEEKITSLDDKYRDIAKAMGVEGTDAMTIEEARKAAVDAVAALAEKVGIPKDLKDILKEEDVQFLSESAFADACRPGNPKDTSVEEIAALYRALL